MMGSAPIGQEERAQAATAHQPGGPRIVLKARPTDRQLADRLAEPVPEGLELYLDARDIESADWQATLLGRLERQAVPRNFTWLVEGPLRSIDGTFFDVTADTAANREVLVRLAAAGAAIGAKAACIHLMAPRPLVAHPSWSEREAILESAMPLLERYVDLCEGAEMVPTIENIPPVARMREGRLMTSIVGLLPSDFAWVSALLPTMRYTLDLSHAQLSINAQLRVANETEDDLADLVESLAAQRETESLVDFVAAMGDRVTTVHVSDADGLAGEGLPYGQGSAPLDEANRLLLESAEFFVAEILEPDPDRSGYMRAAEARLRELRATACPPKGLAS